MEELPNHGHTDPCDLRQVARLEQLWEARGSRLPLRGLVRLWIGIGALWNLNGPRRSPTGRGPRAVSPGSAQRSVFGELLLAPSPVSGQSTSGVQ